MGSFTFRTEGGYWFTEDHDGTEAHLYNDRAVWLAGLYLFEANGYMILPTYTWNIEDDLELSASGKIFGGDDEGSSPYYAWRNNDSVTIGMKHIF